MKFRNNTNMQITVPATSLGLLKHMSDMVGMCLLDITPIVRYQKVETLCGLWEVVALRGDKIT